MVEEDKLLNEVNLRLKEIDDDIGKLNKCIYNLESDYLNTTFLSGNIIKGWEQVFASKPKITSSNQAIGFNKKIKISQAERLFSHMDAKYSIKLESKIFKVKFFIF